MKLVTPSLDYKDAYLAAMQDAQGETSETQLTKPRDGQTFEDFVQILLDHASGNHIPEGKVATSMFWLIEEHKVIGRLTIRHTLNESLRKRGGHIGYYIIPSMRKKGYGREILRLGLIEAKKLGITKAMLTCDIDNIGSQKIIESNGGVFDEIISAPGYPKKAKRYWITL